MPRKLPKTIRLVSLRMVKEKSLAYDRRVRLCEDAVNLVRPLFEGEYREQVAVIGLDADNRPTVVHLVSIGSTNQSMVPIGNVFKPLLLSNASAFILVHNHPSDGLCASRADLELTKRLKEVAKTLDFAMLDHIIVDSACEKYRSLSHEGEL